MKAKNWLYAERMAFSPSKRVCVIGLGNVLMGDDGFGPLAKGFVASINAARTLRFLTSAHLDWISLRICSAWIWS